MTSLIRPLPPSPGALWKSPARELYQPTDFDLRTGIAPRRYRYHSASAQTIQTTTYNMPVLELNKVLNVEHVLLSAGPDAAGAEVLQQMFVQVQGTSSQILGYVFFRHANTATGLGQDAHFSARTDFKLMPGEFLSFVVQKSAAVQSFLIIATVLGMLIPRANIQSG